MSKRSAAGPSQRQLRVGEALRHSLATALARAKFRDPVLETAAVTVTEVQVSPDLRNATVYVMPLGGQAPADVVAALQRAASFLRGQVARDSTLKYMPRFRFKADTSFDVAGRIDRVLRDARARDAASAGDPEQGVAEQDTVEQGAAENATAS